MNKAIVQTEMLRNSSFPTGLNSQDSAVHQAALPFPVYKGSAVPCWGVNGPCSVLHSDSTLTILLGQELSWQHFKSIPVSSKPRAARLFPKGGKIRGPNLFLTIRASSRLSPPQLPSCCAILGGTGAGVSKAPQSCQIGFRIPCSSESCRCVWVTRILDGEDQDRKERQD